MKDMSDNDRLLQSDAAGGRGQAAAGHRRQDVYWQTIDITKDQRAAAKGQRPVILWFTGLSGSGKTTVANLLEKRLFSLGRHTTILDGDNVRHGLNKDLGFSEADRVENLRRVGEVAKLFSEAGLITLVAFISPFRAERRAVRALVGDGEFVEIFVDTPFDECALRDPKGLYARALRGEIKNFTGLDSPYEPPERAEIHLETLGKTPEQMVEVIEGWLVKNGYL